MIEQLPPGWVLVAGALLAPLLRGRARQAWLLALPLLSFWQLWSLPLGFSVSVSFFDYELTLVRIDALARVFATVFHIAAFLSLLYALHVREPLQQVAALVYAGAAIAGTCAGDLISLFVCWEATALASVVLIWARGTPRAYRAGLRYLVIQIGSGLLLLAGTILHYADTASLEFGHLGLVSRGTALIFLGFGIKAAFPLLHNWLQDAYPEATVTGTVFLSTFTTKLAIYALARGFAGTELLVPIGAAMAAFPIFYAVIENDLRRVLAYSLNNQLGFMVVGVGIGTEMSLNGTAAHAFAHVIYEALLFMSMGAVLFRSDTIKASELGGLYRSMPWTTAFCVVGAASISAFPLFSGFIAKGLVMSASAEGHYSLTFAVLLFASAGVFPYSGIKIPYFAFFGRDSGRRVEEAPLHMLIAMGLAAALCVAIGVFPAPLYGLLPYPVDFAPYTTTHVVTQLQLLMFAALAFGFLMLSGIYPPELPSVNLDSDWLYRKPLPAALLWLRVAQARARNALLAPGLRLLHGVASELERHHRPGSGLLGEPWPTGTTAMWAALLLGVVLILYYL